MFPYDPVVKSILQRLHYLQAFWYDQVGRFDSRNFVFEKEANEVVVVVPLIEYVAHRIQLIQLVLLPCQLVYNRNLNLNIFKGFI